MEEEINETVETPIEETVEEVEETPKTHAEREAEKYEEKMGIIDKIKDKVFGHKEEKQEVEVPEEFTKAASAAGLDQDIVDELVKEYTPDQLIELIPHLIEEEEEEVEEEEETVTEQQLPENLSEELKPFYEALRKEFEDRDRERTEELETIKSRLEASDADKVVEGIISEAETADDFFDKISKDFPVFGKTEELHRYSNGPKAGQVIPIGDAFNSRQAVYGMARKFQDVGLDWDDALDEAFAWYKGKHGEKELSKKLVKDLKKNEQRLSAKRSSKSTQKTYASEYEEKLAIIEEAKRKAGIT